MDTIKVTVVDLIERVQENQIKHQKDYDDAMINYAEAHLKAHEDFNELMGKMEPGEAFRETFGEIHKPENHGEDYDRLLAKLNMTVDETVELEDHEFRRYVQDDWDWKRIITAAAASNTQYLGKFQ